MATIMFAQSISAWIAAIRLHCKWEIGLGIVTREINKSDVDVVEEKDTMKIDINDLAKIQGIGPKTIERVREFTLEKQNGNTPAIFKPPLLSINELHVGRAEDLLSHIPSCYIDLTVTSPPYDDLRDYEGFVFNFEAIAKQLYRVTKDGGIVVWIVGDRTVNGSETGTSFRQALFFKEVGFNIHDTMIFRKINPVPLNHNRYDPSFEYIFIFSKKSPKTFNPIRIPTKHPGLVKNRGTEEKASIDSKSSTRKRKEKTAVKKEKYHQNIFSYKVGIEPEEKTKTHPAPFPSKLAKDQITSWSGPNDIVLDPMCGSGTTIEQAILLNRRFIGIDISEEYINDIARPRVEEAINQVENKSLNEEK